MVTIRQIRSVVAVAEEGSFTRAAARENATQSGISQHVAAVEASLETSLFDRSVEGVRPTAAGRRYYTHCVEVLRHLEEAESEVKAAHSSVTGQVRVGLAPALTRAALPSAFKTFTDQYPDVSLEIVEAYTTQLADMVRSEALDFALVPAVAAEPGLTAKHLIRSREVLVSGPSLGLAHGEPVRLSDLGPLNLIVPLPKNIRRGVLESYFVTHAVEVAHRLEMDAMLGTLELVATSEWVSVQPQLVAVADADGATRRISPIIAPDLYTDFVSIEPTRRPINRAGRLFLDAIRSEIERLDAGSVLA